jgi:hypothetical protein
MRAYSEKEKAAEIFMDLIKSISVRGWFNSGPCAPDGKDNLLYVSFHIHPDDADNIHQLISSVTKNRFQNISWALSRTMRNRFFLCPEELNERKVALGEFDAAYNEVQLLNPEYAEQAAKSLIEMSDRIYLDFIASGRKKFEIEE